MVQFTGGVQAVWLPVGFAAAVLYLGDLRWWFGPALADVLLGTGIIPFHGEELTQWTQAQTLGNVLEFTLIAVLMRRWLGPRNRLERPLDVALLLLAIACGTAVSAAIGTFAGWRAGDFVASGVGVGVQDMVARRCLRWVARGAADPRVGRRAAAGVAHGRKLVEAVAIPAAVAGLSVVVFASHHPLTYIVFPVLVFAALNLGQRGGTVAVLLAVGVAIARTADRAGPFATSSIDDTTLDTQLYDLVPSSRR